jgi:hypothetical protein
MASGSLAGKVCSSGLVESGIDRVFLGLTFGFSDHYIASSRSSNRLPPAESVAEPALTGDYILDNGSGK